MQAEFCNDGMGIDSEQLKTGKRLTISASYTKMVPINSSDIDHAKWYEQRITDFCFRTFVKHSGELDKLNSIL